MIRITWKDTNTRGCPPVTYRKISIARYDDGIKKGWTIGIDGDKNIYASQDCARNAINKALGGKPRKDGSRQQQAGIKIVGTI